MELALSFTFVDVYVPSIKKGRTHNSSCLVIHTSSMIALRVGHIAELDLKNKSLCLDDKTVVI